MQSEAHENTHSAFCIKLGFLCVYHMKYKTTHLTKLDSIFRVIKHNLGNVVLYISKERFKPCSEMLAVKAFLAEFCSLFYFFNSRFMFAEMLRYSKGSRFYKIMRHETLKNEISL